MYQNSYVGFCLDQVIQAIIALFNCRIWFSKEKKNEAPSSDIIIILDQHKNEKTTASKGHLIYRWCDQSLTTNSVSLKNRMKPK